MKRTCTRFSAEIGDTAGKLTPFRPQIAGLNFEFLNCVLGRNQNGQVDVTDVQRLAIQVLCALIPKRAINLIIAPTKRIHADRRPSGTALRNYGCREFDQVEYVAAVQRQLIDLPLFHHGAYGGGLCIQQRSPTPHGNAL